MPKYSRSETIDRFEILTKNTFEGTAERSGFCDEDVSSSSTFVLNFDKVFVLSFAGSKKGWNRCNYVILL